VEVAARDERPEVKALRDVLTGIDGSTHDLGRWAGAASFVCGLGLEVFVVVWKSQPFDFTQFGLGVAAMAAGIGAMLKLKSTTEPQENSSHEAPSRTPPA
jgi:hypothetical protein